MKLGKPEYAAWWAGGLCLARPTLKGAIRAARECEARGGAQHRFIQLRNVTVSKGELHK